MSTIHRLGTLAAALLLGACPGRTADETTGASTMDAETSATPDTDESQSSAPESTAPDTLTTAVPETGDDDPGAGCGVGSEGCPCTAGGSCDPGFVCDANVCIPDPCPLGTEGCPCTADGACNPGFFCNTNINVCVSDACPAGTEECHCTPGGNCDPGLICLSEFCVDPP